MIQGFGSDMPQENPKWSPRGSPTEARRVQNGVPEGRRRSPMAQDQGQQRAKCHPKGFRESLLPLGARQVDARGVQGTQGRLVHGFASDFGPQKLPQGVPNGSKKRSNSVSKNIVVSDCVLGSNLTDLGAQKASLSGSGKGSKCV